MAQKGRDWGFIEKGMNRGMRDLYMPGMRLRVCAKDTHVA